MKISAQNRNTQYKNILQYSRQRKKLMISSFDTFLGSMISLADNSGLYLVEFADKRGIENITNQYEHKLNFVISHEENQISKQIAAEMNEYFEAKNAVFKTTLHFSGTSFQKKVWEALRNIPLGQTCSYKEIAKSIDSENAWRAVARANAANPFTIIVPCHRVIYSNGKTGGYACGAARKKWLLTHEHAMTN